MTELPQIILTKVEKKDISEIVDLVNFAYHGTDTKKGWTSEGHLLKGLRLDANELLEIISAQNSIVLGVKNNLKWQGVVHLKNQVDRAWLGMLTVDPHIQAKGLGKNLLTAAETWVQDNWQISKIEMRVFSLRTELLEFYFRRGYQLTGETQDFVSTNPLKEVPHRPNLKFSVLEKTL